MENQKKEEVSLEEAAGIVKFKKEKKKQKENLKNRGKYYKNTGYNPQLIWKD